MIMLSQRTPAHITVGKGDALTCVETPKGTHVLMDYFFIFNSLCYDSEVINSPVM